MNIKPNKCRDTRFKDKYGHRIFEGDYVSKASDGSAIKTSFYVKVLVVSTKIDLKELKSKLPNDMEVFLEEGEEK